MIAKKIVALDLANKFEAANDRHGDMSGLAMRLREEVGEMEPVVSAAVLVTAAFRLKDERGLVAALRRLATAVDVLETQREVD